MEEIYHIPAMLKETIDGLAIKPNGVYVDVTFGGGGHSRAILNHLTPTLSQGEGASPLGGDGREVLDPKELALIQRLTEYPAIVRNAGENFSPAVICNYAYDLACDFNSFYHDLSILNEPDSDKRALRLLLAKNVAKVIQSALSLLGIEVPERM